MGFKKNDLSGEKNLPDVSGFEGMQRLFCIETFNIEKQMNIINYHLANKWKVKDIKKAESGDFILLEYSDKQ
jgi:hypothetical protein